MFNTAVSRPVRAPGGFSLSLLTGAATAFFS